MYFCLNFLSFIAMYHIFLFWGEKITLLFRLVFIIQDFPLILFTNNILYATIFISEIL